MPAPIYADPTDWLAWSGQTDAPDDFVPLLRTASRAVREATALWAYPVDTTTSLPLDPDLLGAMRDATCAQISALITLEVDPAAGGTATDMVESAAKIGSAQITYAGAETVMAARMQTAQGLCPEALGILRDAAQMAAVRVFG
jgi:hypothetical protein